MTPSLIKMWISFAGIGAFAIAALMVALSHTKLSGWFATLVRLIAFIIFLFGTVIMIFVVVSGPTGG
ncbi:MAG: DUF2768 domain-containing protein [Exiguobacterium sp.]|uniref:DUF2768 domain-containing protein n=2 Tax=Exiguobacterium TaxID=33986 RepID=C4L6M5_EXISA|nr:MULTISPECIES: DUF2768 family protein [Exiguobacterium]MBG0916804.1 DUF2768 domain-containing protein [Exiguobacterium sp. SRB7LM]MCC9623682.1 DUF2768 domain-containing protein [Thalassospira sp. MA62]MCM3279939.1 DUF2768 domain-containing protein [Exiguobacterium sp. MER 193]QLQ22181.1 MAG: DUF2768 domain-containing protein [Paracoccaceae bacterium]QPI66564.1 DUF2768 domain-containing protein [Exiguobacterium sp. PBE]